MTGTPATSCPRCGTAASGNFCANCGTPLGSPVCGSCGTELAADAKFCHKCGAAAGGAVPSREAARDWSATPRSAATRRESDRVAWLVAGVLIVAIIAGVAYSAHKRAVPEVPSMANAGNSGAPALGSADGPAGGCAPSGRAPDISNLTPKERFVRLVDRITRYLEQGDTACVITFTPMALGAYANLPPGDRDIDARYHAAMLEAQVGMLDNARALADTIMVTSPDNLFGYYIRAVAAEFAGDSVNAKAARAAFRSHYDAELKKNRPEYTGHRPFLEQYRKGDGAK